MKLLFDHNLSPKLPRRLADLFPNSDHLFPLLLHEADDSAIWEYARNNGFVIVSKDSDFSDRSLLYGHPPKVIRLHLGNCTTDAVEALLRDHAERIAAFEKTSERDASTCRTFRPLYGFSRWMRLQKQRDVCTIDMNGEEEGGN